MKLRQTLPEKYDKASNMDLVWDQIMKSVSSGDPSLTALPTTDYNQLQILTKQWKEIPIGWIEGEQPVLALCMAHMYDLCPNLEVGGVLQASSSVSGKSSWERISSCRAIMDYKCPYWFGQILELYQKWATEVCGDAL